MKRRQSVIVFSRRLSTVLLPKRGGGSAREGRSSSRRRGVAKCSPNKDEDDTSPCHKSLLSEIERSHSLDDHSLAEQLAARKQSFGEEPIRVQSMVNVK